MVVIWRCEFCTCVTSLKLLKYECLLVNVSMVYLDGEIES